MQNLFYDHPWFFVGVFFLICLAALIFGLILTRRTTKYLVRDLGLARHILVTWFAVPFFRLYFWLLQKLNKLQINVNSPIPWEENVIIAANHPMPKTQDVFLLPISLFFLRPRNYFNPIRYFPKITADEHNFFRSWFFWFVGPGSLAVVKRSETGSIAVSDRNGKNSSSIEKEEARFQEYGGVSIHFVERGRTQSALLKNRVKRWTIDDFQELILGRLGLGAAKLAIETDSPVVTVWQQITGDNSYPKITPKIALFGLFELLVNPKIKARIDIGHPNGVLRPLPGEEVRQFTKRIEIALFETGEHQLKRLSRK